MGASITKKILVVEDDDHIAEGLNLNLSLQEYDVAIASDGIAAIDKWQQWRPDLIVLDIMLPGLDGLSVLKQIRQEDKRLPILILSAKSASDDRVRGLSYGVDDYLSKPFDLNEFLLRVERLLTRASWYHPGSTSQTPENAAEKIPMSTLSVKIMSISQHIPAIQKMAASPLQTRRSNCFNCLLPTGEKRSHGKLSWKSDGDIHIPPLPELLTISLSVFVNILKMTLKIPPISEASALSAIFLTMINTGDIAY